MAIDEWNAKGGVQGKQVVLELEDTQTSQKQILSAFHRLALHGSPVILGPTWLDTYQPVVPLAKRKDILLVTPSAAREAFTRENASWAVTFYHNSTTEMAVLVKELRARGLQKIGLIYEEEVFSEMMRRLLLEQVKSLAVDIGVQGGESDFRPMLTKMKQQKPDVLIVFLWNETSLLSFLQQYRLSIPDVSLATIHDGEGWLTNPAFQRHLPRLYYTRFIVVDSTFEERFEKRFGYKPVLTASNAYDAMNAVLSGLDKGITQAGELRHYLLKQKHETATFGTLQFGPSGEVSSEVELVEHG